MFSVPFIVVLYSSLFLISWHYNIVSLPTQDFITAALLCFILFHIFICKKIFEHLNWDYLHIEMATSVMKT